MQAKPRVHAGALGRDGIESSATSRRREPSADAVARVPATTGISSRISYSVHAAEPPEIVGVLRAARGEGPREVVPLLDLTGYSTPVRAEGRWRRRSLQLWTARRKVDPGNHESAGETASGRTRYANRVLREALVESARGAVLKRDCYLAAQYRRLMKRRGDKKAVVAVDSIVVITSHVLRAGHSYRELGGDYFERPNAERLTRYHTKRLAALGYTVTLAKHAA